MVSFAEESLGIEICGLIAGNDETASRIYPGKNILQRPDRFQMDPKDQLAAILQIEAAEDKILAVYHSHPDGSPFPSLIDLTEHFDPEAACIILTKLSGLWQMNAFIIQNCLWTELPLVVSV